MRLVLGRLVAGRLGRLVFHWHGGGFMFWGCAQGILGLVAVRLGACWGCSVFAWLAGLWAFGGALTVMR